VTTESNHRFFLSVWILLGVLLFFIGLWPMVYSDDTGATTLGVVLIVIGIVMAGSSLWMRLQLDRRPGGDGRDLAP